MKVCAIDQSISSSGVVLFELETSRLLDFHLFKTESKKKNGKSETPVEYRIIDSVQNILTYIEEHRCDFVVLEGLSMNNPNSRSARPLSGLFYVLITKLIERDIAFEYYPPMEVKKFMAENISEWPETMKYKNAKAKKEELGDLFVPTDVLNLFKDSGVKKTTGLYDLCDAYAIGRYKLYLENKNNNGGIQVLKN
jgi:Holliday junction resolvasome RuvABC endonuclease subunit